MKIIDEALVKSVILKRDENAHKYSVGTALAICGSYGMAGAGIMSGKAMLRSGIGLLKMAVDKSIYPIMAQALPEAVFVVLDGKVDVDAILGKEKCILLGCGLSTSPFAEKLVTEIIRNSTVPMVLDADALNIISKNPYILKLKKAPVIITPHNMEMARLVDLPLKELEANREKIALDFSVKNNVITVLKGKDTIVASPNGEVYHNVLTGNSGMATGGSGDVLSGIMASLIAQGGDIYKKACASVYIHGLAGDIAKEEFGEISMTATDIITSLPKAFLSLS